MKQASLWTDSSALFDESRLFRYRLERVFGTGKGIVCFIGLNPSTADETNDDPTVRREINYALRWGYAGIYKVNLFALRSTDPLGVLRAASPIGDPENIGHILQAAWDAHLVVAAWGEPSPPRLRKLTADRASYVVSRLWEAKIELACLATTQSGAPRHPLYLSGDLKPRRWSEDALLSGVRET